MRIGICDACDEKRIIKPVFDYFDVHILNLCKYGCDDPRSKKEIKIRSRKYKLTKQIHVYKIKRNGLVIDGSLTNKHFLGRKVILWQISRRN